MKKFLRAKGKGNHKGLPPGVLNLSQFIGLLFTLFLFLMGRWWANGRLQSGFILSSLPPVYPPYKSWVKKSHPVPEI